MAPPVASSGRLRFEVALEPIDLVLDLGHVPLVAQVRVVVLQAQRARAARAAARLRLGLDHLQLQIRVLERDDRLAGLDERAFFGVHLGDLAAADRVEIDRRARHDVARYRDVLAERAIAHLRHREPLRADGERAREPEWTYA